MAQPYTEKIVEIILLISFVLLIFAIRKRNDKYYGNL